MIERRTRRRSQYATHAVLFAGFALANIVFLLSPVFWRGFMTLPNTGDLLLILFTWGVIFAAHSARFLTQEAGDRALAALEKPKRDFGHLALDEDGEITLLPDETTPRYEKRR